MLIEDGADGWIGPYFIFYCSVQPMVGLFMVSLTFNIKKTRTCEGFAPRAGLEPTT